MKSPAPELDLVVRAAQEAGQLALQLGPGRSQRKSDGSWVTEADVAVAELLAQSLNRILPDAARLDEERGGAIGAGCTWVVDPIDGTTNFRRGDDRWCVSVALLAQGVPILGVIHQPSLDRTWAADHTGPRFLVDGPGDVGLLVGGRLSWSPVRLSRAARQLRRPSSVRLSGSAALDFVDVACGRAGQLVGMGLSVWDYAAGMVLVESVGGVVHRWPVGHRWDLVAQHPSP